MPKEKTSPLQTEYEFSLPKGYIDEDRNLNRTGIMRLATAMDEIAPLREPRVRENQAYLTIAILARVITRLGDLTEITPGIIEALFTADIGYLQDFYRQINGDGSDALTVTCPECSHTFAVERGTVGE